jgi:hypothetical protein
MSRRPVTPGRAPALTAVNAARTTSHFGDMARSWTSDV